MVYKSVTLKTLEINSVESGEEEGSRAVNSIEKIQRDQSYQLKSVDLIFNGYILTYIEYTLF